MKSHHLLEKLHDSLYRQEHKSRETFIVSTYKNTDLKKNKLSLQTKNRDIFYHLNVYIFIYIFHINYHFINHP